jgi:subtilisin-like proprotein convertase family protein
MTKYLIAPNDAQRILNYLQARPYAEVFQLINVLSAMEKTECLDATGEGEE